VKNWFRNKYFLSIVGLLGWLIFFDEDHIAKQFGLYMDLRERKQQVHYLEQQIDSLRKDRAQLFADPESRERFAREKYLMKRDNEDLFIVTPPATDED
jgi:cell division protein FtsB